MSRASSPVAAAAALALLLAGPGTARADMLQMKDGRVVEGVRLERKDDALLLHYPSGDVRVPLATVEDFAIEGAPPPEPATEEERAKRAQGMVPFRGKWVAVADRDRALKKETDARRKAIAEYARHSQWRDRYQFKTANFEFESTLPEEVNENFSALLETYFKEFGKVWKTQMPKGWGRLKVCFYKDEQEFLNTTGVPRGTQAYYRFAEPRELNFFYDRGQVDVCVSILFHEANHYLTHLLNARFRAPHWVNEAMAEYYGASIWDPLKRTMKIGGVQQGRLAEVRADISTGKKWAIRDLIADESRDYEHYTWGWSLVHFLMEDPRYRAKFMRFFADLAVAPDVERRPIDLPGFTEVKGGREILRVFLSRMGMKEGDLPALEKEWYAHIDGMDASAVRGLEMGGIHAYMDGKWKFRAPRMLEEAMAKGSTNTDVYRVYARCMGLRGDPESCGKATAALEKATVFDPLSADLRAEMGLYLFLAGNQAEGERLVALAGEMDPDTDYVQIINIQKKLAEVKAGGGE